MLDSECLVGYGRSGDFGRFRGTGRAPDRGTRVVVRTPRGVEIGQVLRPADERLARWLPNTTVGRLLRAATAADEAASARLAARAGELLARGNALIAGASMPVALLDAEILLEGANAVLLSVRWGECDVRELVRPLSSEFALTIALCDLGAKAEDSHDDHDHGCGSCGEGGGCGDCGSGGCGSCATPPAEASFAGLREQMERRVPLL